jgi:hypothetical protein
VVHGTPKKMTYSSIRSLIRAQEAQVKEITNQTKK